MPVDGRRSLWAVRITSLLWSKSCAGSGTNTWNGWDCGGAVVAQVKQSDKMKPSRQLRFDDTAESTDLWRLAERYGPTMESTYQHDYKAPVMMAPPIRAHPPPSRDLWNHSVRLATMETTYQHDYKWPVPIVVPPLSGNYRVTMRAFQTNNENKESLQQMSPRNATANKRDLAESIITKEPTAKSWAPAVFIIAETF